VVQLYIAGGSGDGAPIRSLRGFERIHLKAGESRQVTFAVAAADLPPVAVEVSVGGGQPLTGIPRVTGTLSVP
jgi:beta-glucosidase